MHLSIHPMFQKRLRCTMPSSLHIRADMRGLHDDAWKGTLTLDRLKLYLANASAGLIDNAGGPHSVAPLAAACWQGHLETVRLLLNNPYHNANPNARDQQQRVALFYATTCSPAKDRAAIVRALLNAGADVDACSPADGYSTPLMNALSILQDRDVVHELVDRGASLTKKNSKGMTAETMARERGMERDLRSRDQRGANRAEIIDLIVSIVLLIIAVVNSGTLKDVVKDVVHKLYSITGAQDPELVRDIPAGDDIQQFTEHLDSYVADTGLEKFFAPQDPFLQTLARKAAALRDDPTTDLGSFDNIKRLTVLSLYQIVVYCDDSISMGSFDRYALLKDLVKRIARVGTKIVPDGQGVDLRFINNEFAQNVTASDVEAAMNTVYPSAGTMIGTALWLRILQPLVYDILDSGKQLKHPLLVCTITDGCPCGEADDTFKNAIVECRRRLVNAGYESKAVMFCVSQIGDDKGGAAFLQRLTEDPEIADVIYCTTDLLDSKFKELRQNENRLEEWLLKVLTNPLIARDQVPTAPILLSTH